MDLSGSLLVPRDCRTTPSVTVDTKREWDALVMTGHEGRYLETKRAVFPLVDMTMMAPAFCSIAAATAEMATVSEVVVGRRTRARSWLKRGGYEMEDSARKQVSAIISTAIDGSEGDRG